MRKMVKYNIKCNKCGYIFQPEEDRSKYVCPKCGNIIELYKEVVPKRNSKYEF